jgi:hypothetical protein
MFRQTLTTLYQTVHPIVASQALDGLGFYGQAVGASLLTPVVQYSPSFQTIHGDVGNTRTGHYAAPLGVNPVVQSYHSPLFGPIFWDDAGQITTTVVTQGGVAYLAALHPNTLDILTTYPTLGEPTNLTLSSVIYTQAQGNRIIAADDAQHVVEVKRSETKEGGALFTKMRDTDLSQVLPQGAKLIGVGHDSQDNLWFVTGGITSLHAPTTSSAMVGFRDPSGKVHTLGLEMTQVENNFAVNGARVFLVTGPPNADTDPTGSKGYLYALEAGPDGVQTVFKAPYDAGSGIKQGALSRGTGASPSLLGHKYVAITDNAEGQVNIKIYPQFPDDATAVEPVCTVPIFTPGASAVENAMVAYWDGGSTYSVVANNFFNAPSAFQAFTGKAWPLPDAVLNFPINNLTQLAPGMVRVDFDEETMSCSSRWTNWDLRTHVAPILSTRTGLLYVSTQDFDLAVKGNYQYYLAAFDFDSGKEVWRVRQGAGGSFLATLPPMLTRDGGVGQCVMRGFVKVTDGKSCTAKPAHDEP